MPIVAPMSAEDRLDQMARLVFEEAIALLGGLRQLVEYRNLTWLPSLATAAYTVVLAEEGGYSRREIAERLGISEATVTHILRADPEAVERILHREEEVSTHKAGAIAKAAYRQLQRKGFQESTLITEEIAEILDIAWAFHVLVHLRGVDFPVTSPEALADRLRDVRVKGRSVAELLSRIAYPVNTPAELLHRLKEAAAQAGE